MNFIKKITPSIFKRNIGELIYLGAQYSTPVISFFVNVLIMKFVGPETLGKYQSIILWSSYLTFLHLGVFNGLNRNLAYYKGSNQTEKLDQATSTGFFFSLAVSIVSFLIIFFIAKSTLNDHSNVAQWAFAFLFASALTQPIKTFFDTLYRTGEDFKKLGKLIIIENVLFGANSIWMLLFGYVGFIVQNILKILVGLILRIKYKISGIKFNFSFQSLKDQVNTGFLIMVNGYLYTTFFIFDQFYIVRNFDRIELGYYNLARLILMIVPIIPISLTTVFYPKASIAYGKSGDNKIVLKSFFKKALLINLLVVLPIIIIVYFTIPFIVNNFLPQYVKGIKYARISVWGGLGYIYVGPSVIMGVLKKNRLNFILLAVLSACSYGFYFSDIIHFRNIETLIWYKNILFIGYALLMLLYIYFILLKSENVSKTN